ncbi:hypothetical protein WN944_023171 [Citrus x changshan-huyou]|uniref:Uncharacterized protein n=1 Tax=Citrus x changshan-huyou TaxID=2935761 RepID=A0AAP0R0Y8_9ROSI
MMGRISQPLKPSAARRSTKAMSLMTRRKPRCNSTVEAYNILRAWPLRITSEELVEAKSGVGTDKQV